MFKKQVCKFVKQILPSCPRITGYEIPHLDWKNKCCWRSGLLSVEVNKEPAADFRCEGFGSAPESCCTHPMQTKSIVSLICTQQILALYSWSKQQIAGRSCLLRIFSKTWPVFSYNKATWYQSLKKFFCLSCRSYFETTV